MKDRTKTLLAVGLLAAIILVFFGKILVTDKIVRAPDIINEFYWTVKDTARMSFADAFRFNLQADWNPYQNSGSTTEGGWVSQQLLLAKTLIFWLIPAPVSIAWFMALCLVFSGIGTYLCCRLIGASRLGAVLGGLVFALATEQVSLINAGHVLKIATIAFAPWVFYCYERALLSRRLVWFLTVGMVLAFQFFHGHWQIAYYTCLALGVYGIVRFVGILKQERGAAAGRLLALNVVMIAFFFSAVAMSLLPLASWSKDTNRGVQSGENRGKGGLNMDEAMSWSMPPEELATFVVPGMFGLSRQEAGENPPAIGSYYWGRMHFTQTNDYMGLLPWILVPLPLLFRRDRYTWLSVGAIAGGLVFSMGKYSIVYQLLYEYLPGINRFRVPKMMLFIPTLGLAVLAARGIDCLRDPVVRASQAFRRYQQWIWGLPVLLLVLLAVVYWGQSFWINRFIELLAQPTRYEQGMQLVTQRWGNLVTEVAIASGVAAVYAAALSLTRAGGVVKLLPALLVVLFVADVGRINAKFLPLATTPQKASAATTPVMDFLLRQPEQGSFRVFPLSTDPMPYAAKKIPVVFTSSPVQQQRWQEYLDNLSLVSPMVDLLNVRFLIMDQEQYQAEKGSLGERYVPVFSSPDGKELVLENRQVLPKAWLVSSVLVVQEPKAALRILQNPGFTADRLAVVESPPAIALDTANNPAPAGLAKLESYAGEQIVLQVSAARNALLVVGEKFAQGWQATVDGKPTAIVPVNYILRGVYLPPGNHRVEFVFAPASFRIGKTLTLSAFAVYAVMLAWEWRRRKNEKAL